MTQKERLELLIMHETLEYNKYRNVWILTKEESEHEEINYELYLYHNDLLNELKRKLEEMI